MDRDNPKLWGAFYDTLPMGAAPSDRIVSTDDAGRPVYETPYGQKYSIQGRRQQSVDDIFAQQDAMFKSYDRPASSAVGDAASALAHLFWSGITAPKRALDGEMITNSDVWNTGGMAQLGAAPMRSPSGSLRSGSMVNTAGSKTAGMTQADDIMDLLSSGRGREVTDSMMAGADQGYLSSIYDLPLDDASRLSRAKGAGYDYARGSQSADTPFNDVPWAMFAKSRGGDIEGLAEELTGTYGRHGKGGTWLARAVNSEWQSAKDMVRAGREASRYTGISGAETARRARPDSIVDGADLWDSLDDAKNVVDELASARVGSVTTPDGLVAILDDFRGIAPEGVRAYTARFDPRLQHLRNYLAGAAGVSAAGVGGMQQNKQARGIEMGM